MSPDDRAKLYQLVAHVLGLPPEAIGPELSAAACEQWDSANHLRLVLAAEEAFGVRFALEEIEGLTDIGRLAKIIERKQGGR